MAVKNETLNPRFELILLVAIIAVFCMIIMFFRAG